MLLKITVSLINVTAKVIIPPATEGEGWVYWFEPVCPSVRCPSVDKSLWMR